uniref:CUB domain-containing protein n=1 Tax=Acrobeloides nanus TaxID=290746 RepID=A0A914DUX5_9BILA
MLVSYVSGYCWTVEKQLRFTIPFLLIWLAPVRLCPVYVISKNAHSTPSSIFTSQDIENTETLFSEVNYEATVPFPNNTGIISSSNFVANEFSKFKCQFIFVGAVDEHVQISFQKFNLFLWKNLGDNISSIRCEEKDHVSTHVLVGSRMSKISDFCGSEMPPQLMSARNILTIEYFIKSANSREPKPDDDYGFTLEYRFLPDYSSLMPPEALRVPNRKCGLIFNGTIQTSGNLWSVNYPGFYPRDLDCEYVFNGRDSQIVLIHFEYFDVEGFGQCEESTHSDYILFSNYRTTDRTNRRYCGNQRPPKAIASESNYFRMIFLY